MPKYIITDCVPCWVDFVYTVEAENETEARRKYNDGESVFLNPNILDNIDGMESDVTIEESR